MSAVSMALKPRSVKRSSSSKERASPAVQPNTLPPKTRGAISMPERPRVRFCMIRSPVSSGGGAASEHASQYAVLLHEMVHQGNRGVADHQDQQAPCNQRMHTAERGHPVDAAFAG